MVYVSIKEVKTYIYKKKYRCLGISIACSVLNEMVRIQGKIKTGPSLTGVFRHFWGEIITDKSHKTGISFILKLTFDFILPAPFRKTNYLFCLVHIKIVFTFRSNLSQYYQCFWTYWHLLAWMQEAHKGDPLHVVKIKLLMPKISVKLFICKTF